MARNTQRDNSTLMKTICAIVFILFTFIYLYCFQADLLTAEQHVLSGGTTHYDRTVGAILITLILYLVQLGISRLTFFPGSLYALTYFPPLLLLMLLTAFYNGCDSFHLSYIWLFIAVVLAVVYAIVCFFYNKRRAFINSLSLSRNNFFDCFWKNMLIFALMTMMVCVGGNTDEVFHYRLRVERLLAENDYYGALQVGNKSLNTDESLTMLRIYALSRTRMLGERLFEYPLSGKANALLPDDKNIKCMFYPESEMFKQLGIRKKGRMKPMEYLLYLKNHGMALKPVADYILCGYLLNKDLDGFVKEIKLRYSLSSSSLPKHYREALTLYTHMRSNPEVVYHNEIMDVDYADFQKLDSIYSDKREKTSHIRDAYGETYWFYYFYQ